MERIICGATAEQLEELLEYVEGRMGPPREFFRSWFQTCPPANPEDSRIALIGDRIVSHIRVYRRDLRLRGSVVPSGHLGTVSTHVDFRRQGHGRALLRDCVEYIGSLGFPLSCVWSGATEFYPCEHWVRFPLIGTSLHLPFWGCRLSPDVRVRRYRRGSDDAAVADIYDEYNRGRNLSAVRDAEYWRLHHSWIRGEEEDGFLIAERQGRPVAYCRARRAEIMEYAARDGQQDAGLAVVDALVRRERSHKTEHLQMILPPDETVITGNPQLRYTRTLNETMLMRVIDLKGILDVALRTAGERLNGIGLAGPHTIAIEVLGQKCAMHFERGTVAVASLPDSAAATPLAQAEFFKLIFGSNIEKDLSAFSRDDRHLLNDLFPADGPIYWTADVT